MDLVDELRGFNRFYTRKIGLLEAHLPGGDFTLGEARVLYELAQRDGQTAAEISRTLNLDKARVSRILARFRARKLVRSRTNSDHRKRLLLSLTEAGTRAFAGLEQGARGQMAAVLSNVEASARPRLADALREVRSTLESERSGEVAVGLRKPIQGDLGWVAHRQMVLYHQEYGWDWTYEGLACEILGKFVAEFDPAREDAWIAERDGAVIGSVFLMKSDDREIGKLRLLYVEGNARGLGIGTRLVNACLQRAREFGYRKITLWTNDVLVSARRIYQAAGFVLTAENPHHSFGCDLVGQTWTLDLEK